MKRDIKFRAWGGNRMLYWEHLKSLRYAIENSNIVVEQYTGLKDQNGIEIYEGDIIKYNFKTPVTDGEFQGPVFFDEFMWLTNEHSLNRICNIEVIGNIHQNPELL